MAYACSPGLDLNGLAKRPCDWRSNGVTTRPMNHENPGNEIDIYGNRRPCKYNNTGIETDPGRR